MTLLQIYFQVEKNKATGFEEVYERFYVPALQKQIGYLGSKLLRIYSPEIASEFDATPTEFNYQMELYFDTEENRRIWAASKDHEVVWEIVEFLFEKAQWRGYDIVSGDELKVT